MRRHLFITGLCLLTATALAQGFVESSPRMSSGAPGSFSTAIGPDQAAAIARAQTGGRLLDVQPVPDDERSAYAVRLLLEAGRVRTVVVDGHSGQIR